MQRGWHDDCFNGYSLPFRVLFLPARNEKGNLEYVDIITSFASAQGDVRIPTELVLPRMSDEEQCRLFTEKLELIETCQHFLFNERFLPGLI